jgi:transposase
VAAHRFDCLAHFLPRLGEAGSLLPRVTGIVVHDHWKPYYTMAGVLHALCNAHHLRELKALVEIEKEDWARKMQRLLSRACHATNLTREQGVPLKPGLIALIERCYDAIVADGLALHEAQPALTKTRPRGRLPRRVGHNLLLRLSTRKQDVLRFLTDPRVPFTNNLAERDGRMMKLWQKISGGFRSEDGAKDFAVIRSLLSTARKQEWDLLQTLTRSKGSARFGFTVVKLSFEECTLGCLRERACPRAWSRVIACWATGRGCMSSQAPGEGTLSRVTDAAGHSRRRARCRSRLGDPSHSSYSILDRPCVGADRRCPIARRPVTTCEADPVVKPGSACSPRGRTGRDRCFHRHPARCRAR